MECLRFPFEISLVRMVHVGHARTHRVKGFERTDERSGQKNLNFDAPAGCGADRFRETNSTWVEAGQTFGPVGHHL